MLLVIMMCVFLIVGSAENGREKTDASLPQETKTDVDRGSELAVANKDDAVRSYLAMAQIHAEIYRYTNNNSYNGVCEHSDVLYTLEGGILKYIKMVGATEVYCMSAENAYMIEAKLPGTQRFYCIDSTGARGERKSTSEGMQECAAQ